jgi:putative transcriptional regulator
MNLDLDILRIISNDVKPELGKILISEPLLNDVYFSRSVVYLIDDIDESFMGLVLNNPSEIKLRDVVEGFEDASHKLYIGGPVEPDVLFYIHTSSLVTGADLIANGLYFGGELDEIRELVKCGVLNEENIKFFLGSSGWAPGQLNEEISFNSWLVANCDDDFIFCDDSVMWQNSLNFVESRYKIWKNFPLDPELN